MRRCCADTIKWVLSKADHHVERGAEIECRWCDSVLRYEGGDAWTPLTPVQAAADYVESRIKRYEAITGKPFRVDK